MMEQLKQVLVAMDTKKHTQSLIGAALLVAGPFQSRITLFHAIPEVKGSPLQRPELVEFTERFLDQAEKEIAQHGPQVKSAVAFGPPVASILGAADEHQADLIMIGSGSKELNERFQLGVTAEQIVRHSPRPVWMVGPGQTSNVDRILCPVDFSPHSRKALDFAVGFARAFKADLTVLTVVEKLSNIYPGRPVIKPLEQGSYGEDRAAEFEAFLADVDFDEVKWQKVILEGEPHEEILGFIRKGGCPLIVMGSEGRTGLMRFILGSVAEKVIREVPCSTVTVKADA